MCLELMKLLFEAQLLQCTCNLNFDGGGHVNCERVKYMNLFSLCFTEGLCVFYQKMALFVADFSCLWK